MTRDCGGHFSGLQGTITSPGYPDEYANLMVCEWFITVDQGYRVQLEIIGIDMEVSQNCMYDSLEVRLVVLL